MLRRRDERGVERGRDVRLRVDEEGAVGDGERPVGSDFLEEGAEGEADFGAAAVCPDDDGEAEGGVEGGGERLVEGVFGEGGVGEGVGFVRAGAAGLVGVG